jgi:hypothetical protein
VKRSWIGGGPTTVESPRVVDSVVALRHRLRLLLSNRYAGGAVSPVLRQLRAHGPVALFGGAVRDLAVNRPSAFRSDLDLVINGEPDAVGATLVHLGGHRNRFGGYRLRLGHWTVDAWPLGATWAIRSGIVECRTFADLARTTFFNWDGVAYDVSNDILYADDSYLSSLRTRLLELNLEPNPNPLGNIIRALRLAASGRATLGPRLSAYVAHTMEPYLRTGDVRGDLGLWTHFPSAPRAYVHFFTADVVRQLLLQLHAHVMIRPQEPFAVSPSQLPLGFSDDSRVEP